jgi:hypothetical protein
MSSAGVSAVLVFMENSSNEGISYLQALRRDSSTSGGAAAASAREQEPPPDSASESASSGYQGAEKRRTARYHCEGSVHIREEGRDVSTWAAFTDISLHGCYVEAQATYPAGTVLHLQLDANGIRVEATGTVRVNYPYLGMGISFSEISNENVLRLRQLLAAISRPCVIMGPGIASSLPSTTPSEAVPPITNPGAAVQGLIEFFESRQMLMREDFLRILRKSQTAPE